MQSYARSLLFTAALTFAAIVGVLVTASPQDRSAKPAGDRRSPPADLSTAPVLKPVKEAPPTPPITFADPDGQELVLEELSARTAIHGMLSLTELELRFRNPQSRRIEGRFTCTLPPNAAISRFAKEINGQLMEGEVVERLRANQVYEQFLHQMRDPALLEQDQGNRFSARIFPIDPGAPVRLLVSYTTLLPMRAGVRTYSLPLRGLSKVNKLTFRAFVTPVPGESTSGKMTTSTAEVTSFDQRDWTPDRDIELTWRADNDAPRTRVLRAGDFYLAAVRPAVSTANRQPPTANWLLYVDTSASSAEGAQHRVTAIEELLAALPPRQRVQLVAFDQDVVPLASGTASELSRTAGELLRTRLFLGGTDLGGLLRDAAKRLREDGSQTVVVASDLVPTLGDVAAHDLEAPLALLPPHATIHALILGSRENGAFAKSLTAGRGRIVRVPFSDSLATRAREAADELQRPLGMSFDATDPGAEWIYPAHFDDVAAGDEVLVLGKVKAGGDTRLRLGSAEVSGGTRLDASTFGPLLEREAYRAYLDYLGEREAGEASEAVRRALAAEQVRLSVEQRVVTPRTTMLVLESEWDYQRFNLNRRALAAILTIDAGGIGRMDRRGAEVMLQAQVQSTVPPPPRPISTQAKSAPRREAAANERFRESDEVGEAVPGDMEEGVKGGVEEGVAGGVPGGVVGGVVGGVAGGAVRGFASTSDAVSQPVTVADAAPAEAPAMRVAPSPSVPRPPVPAPPPPPAQIREERSKSETSWTRHDRPSRESIKELEAKLAQDPRDREVYNQLGETLAAWEEWSALRHLTLRWQPYDPENPQVYELLGTAAEELGNETEAARAFASLIEIAPAKPELLQRAGLLLLRAGRARLAEAPLRRALELRPDRANSYRHLALMLWREGRVEEAARVLESATRQDFPGWYGGVQRVIHEELGYVYRAWARKDPSRKDEIADRAREYAVDLTRNDALRVTLAWETDANDVDLHVVDPSGEECYYGHTETRAGLRLYEDITQGLGPEVIRTGSLKNGTYHVGVRYFAAGPMGISRGVVVVVRGDDQVEIHPFRLAQGGGDIRYVATVTTKNPPSPRKG
jgi:tetratricopeptide (TPR) repeat protein